MKMKTKSTLKKRVKITATGKVKVKKSCKSHLLINKSKRQKKAGQSSNGVIIHKAHAQRLKKLLPYK